MTFGDYTQGNHHTKQSHQHGRQDPQTPPEETAFLEERRGVAVHTGAALIVPREHPSHRTTADHHD